MTVFLRTVSAGGSILLALIVEKELGLEQLGALTFVLSTSMLGSILIRFGGDKLAIRHFLENKYWAVKRLVISQLSLSFVVLVVAILLFFAFFSNNMPFQYVYIVPMATLFVLGYNLTSLAVGSGNTQFACITQIGFIQFILAVILWFVSSHVDWMLSKVFFIIVLIYVFLIGLSCYFQRELISLVVSSRVRAEEQKGCQKERFYFFIANLGGTFQTVSLYALLGLMMTSMELGEFRYLERVAAVVSFLSIFQNIMIPKYVFSDGQATLNKFTIKKIKKAQAISLSFVFVIICIGLGVVFFNADNESFSAILTYEWFLLAFAHAVIASVAVINVVFLFAREEVFLMKMQVVFLFLSLALYPIQYYYWGVQGVYLAFAELAVMKGIVLYGKYSLIVENIKAN